MESASGTIKKRLSHKGSKQAQAIKTIPGYCRFLLPARTQEQNSSLRSRVKPAIRQVQIPVLQPLTGTPSINPIIKQAFFIRKAAMHRVPKAVVARSRKASKAMPLWIAKTLIFFQTSLNQRAMRTSMLLTLIISLLASATVDAQAIMSFENRTTTQNCTSTACQYADPISAASAHELMDVGGIPVNSEVTPGVLGFKYFSGQAGLVQATRALPTVFFWLRCRHNDQ